jgi:hypothetical protein
MPLELRSFLFAVSVILALALFVPCIESIINFVRWKTRQTEDTNAADLQPLTASSRVKPTAGLSREIA